MKYKDGMENEGLDNPRPDSDYFSAFVKNIKHGITAGLIGFMLFSCSPKDEHIRSVNITACEGTPIGAIATDYDNSISCEISLYSKIIIDDQEISFDQLESSIDSHDDDYTLSFQLVPYLKYNININDAGENEVTSYVNPFGFFDESEFNHYSETIKTLEDYVRNSLAEDNVPKVEYIRRTESDSARPYGDLHWTDDNETCIGIAEFVDRNGYLTIKDDTIIIDMLTGSGDYSMTVIELRNYIREFKESL
ncbi:MAG: hypothetical protein ABIF08_03865 [Nanoarchaeota archaeon]